MGIFEADYASNHSDTVTTEEIHFKGISFYKWVKNWVCKKASN